MRDLIGQLRDAINGAPVRRHQIARDTGVAESVLSRLVNGKAGVSVETYQRLADYLGLELVLRPKRGRDGRRKGG